jgi:hypothetical protein
VQKKPFSVFDYILVEILSISKNALCSCGYALHIMMMIEKVTGIHFVKDIEITNLEPQFLATPVITIDVPSSLAAPCSTHSGMAVSSTCYLFLLLQQYLEGAQEHGHLVSGHPPAS